MAAFLVPDAELSSNQLVLRAAVAAYLGRYRGQTASTPTPTSGSSSAGATSRTCPRFGMAISTRSTVERETLVPSRASTADPARPATTTARSPISPVSSTVRRAHRDVSAGICSRNVRRGHDFVEQTSLRTRRSMTTPRPPTGRSASRRR